MSRRLHIRRAGRLDDRPMAELLAALRGPAGPAPRAADLMARREADSRTIWHIAEDDSGTLLGFQWLDPGQGVAAPGARITTVTVPEPGHPEIASALFERTRADALAAGFQWIDAEVRFDNVGGLAFYQSRGFEDLGSSGDRRIKRLRL